MSTLLLINSQKITCGRMTFSNTQKRGILDWSFQSVKLLFHQDSSAAVIRDKLQCLFWSNSEGGSFYLMQRVCRLSLLILKLKVQMDRRALFQLAVEMDKTYISENGVSKFQLAVEIDKTYISENGASKFQLAVEMDKTQNCYQQWCPCTLAVHSTWPLQQPII